ncbi:MAG: two-component regulator propeller domain-containing protein [Lysobacterales bacterium]
MGESQPFRRQSSRWVHNRAQPFHAFIFALLLLAALQTAIAADGASVRFRNIGVEQGLSQVSATDILEDRHGFLWVGTQDGLNRYDGYRFQIFRHQSANPDSLSDNYVLSLAKSEDGSLWVGTLNGLDRLDPMTGKFEHFPVGDAPGDLHDSLVTDVSVGTDGSVLVSTRRGGIQRLDVATRRFVDVPELPAFKQRQRVLLVRRDGVVLVSNDLAVLEWNPTSADVRELPLEGAGAIGGVLAASLSPNGGYALGTVAEGVLLTDPEGRVLRHLRADDEINPLPDNAIRALHYDPRNRLWMGTAQGLARINPDDSVTIWRSDSADPTALPGDRVVALHEDRNGLLWVGTWTGGLARFDPATEEFRLLAQRTADGAGLPANAVSALSADPDGSIWLGMVDRGGVVQLSADGKILRRMDSHSEAAWRLSSDDVSGLLAVPDGLWVGYIRGGLDFFGAQGLARRFLPGDSPDSLNGTSVQALAVDHDGSLWVGALGGGVYSLCADCTEPRRWPVDAGGQTGPVGSSVNQIMVSRNGFVWFAIRRGGLSWYEPASGRWGALKESTDGELGLPGETATSLFEDDKGMLWVGTQGAGISRIARDAEGRPQSLQNYSESEGLVSAMVGAFLGAGDGSVWVSTTRGLCRIITTQEVVFECFGDRDPILGIDFFVASAATDIRGGLHFGSSRGLVSIANPAQAHFPTGQAAVVLTELRVGNRPMFPGEPNSPLEGPIENAEKVRLRYDQDLLSIEFAALDFRRSMSVQYRYRLRGRGKDWIETEATRRTATFMGLPFGNYQFEVEALDGGSVVGRRELAIEVLPPPWLTPAARLGYALLLGLLIALAAWRFRVRLREREKVQDTLAQSEAMLKYSLWGSRGELWDADLVSGRMIRRNRLEHLAVTREASNDSLEAYAPFVHEDDRPRFNAAMVASMKGSADLFECSYRSRDIDGQWRWLLSRGRVFSRDAMGRATRMVGTTFDITELRANEDALRKSEDRLNLALWSSGDEMWDIDLAGGLVRRENPLAVVALSPETQFASLQDYMKHVHPSDQERLRNALIMHLKGDVDHFECGYRVVAAHGGWLWVLGKGRVRARDEQGRATRLVGTNRDITQLKQVEEDLRRLNEELEVRVSKRTEALEQSNTDLKRTLDQLTRAQRQLVESEKLAALGGLVAGVAHEINTPLGVGVTAASHLQQETESLARLMADSRMTRADLDRFIEQARLSSDLVLRNLDRASHLVKSFKQVAVDQSSEQRRVINARDYLGEILLSLHPRIKKTRAKVVIECPEDLTMDTYPGALYQIVVNLVMNSLVHAFDDDTEGQIRIEVQRQDDLVSLEYRDNGKGMPEDIRRRVFEPFFTTRRGSGGSGLGLHIVYNLATQILRGTVSCDSELGQGTSFRFLIPRIAPAGAETAEAKRHGG